MPQNIATPIPSEDAIQDLERQIASLTERLNAMRRASSGTEVPNYRLSTLQGGVRLRDLFAGQDKLLAIHNMGQGCRYCTLWADSINGFLPHLESVMAVVLLSKDPPNVQHRFAGSRGWRFRLASHEGGAYIREQSTMPGQSNMPGAVLYERRDEVIRRKNAVVFGPGDMYCSAWNFLALGGFGTENWTPQYQYWQRPTTLDDGGENVLG